MAVTAQQLVSNGVNANYAANLASMINSLNPQIQDRYANTVVQFYQTHGKQGYDLDINQASRTAAEQRAIRSTGVKAASPRNTWHIGGGAADFTVLKNGKKDTGTKYKNAYQELLAPIAKVNGLRNPIRNDVGHFQPVEVPLARRGQNVADFIDPSKGVYPSLFGREPLVASADIPTPRLRPDATLEPNAYQQIVDNAVQPAAVQDDVALPIMQAAAVENIPEAVDDMSLGGIDTPRGTAQHIGAYTDNGLIVPQGPYGAEKVVQAALSGNPLAFAASLASLQQRALSAEAGPQLKSGQPIDYGAVKTAAAAKLGGYFGSQGALIQQAPYLAGSLQKSISPAMMEMLPAEIRPEIEAVLKAAGPAMAEMPLPVPRPEMRVPPVAGAGIAPMAASPQQQAAERIIQVIGQSGSAPAERFTGDQIAQRTRDQIVRPASDQIVQPITSATSAMSLAPPSPIGGVGEWFSPSQVSASPAKINFEDEVRRALQEYRPATPSPDQRPAIEFSDLFDSQQPITQSQFSQRFDPVPQQPITMDQFSERFDGPTAQPAQSPPPSYPTGNSPISPELGIESYQMPERNVPPANLARYTSGLSAYVPNVPSASRTPLMEPASLASGMSGGPSGLGGAMAGTLALAPPMPLSGTMSGGPGNYGGSIAGAAQLTPEAKYAQAVESYRLQPQQQAAIERIIQSSPAKSAGPPSMSEFLGSQGITGVVSPMSSAGPPPTLSQFMASQGIIHVPPASQFGINDKPIPTVKPPPPEPIRLATPAPMAAAARPRAVPAQTRAGVRTPSTPSGIVKAALGKPSGIGGILGNLFGGESLLGGLFSGGGNTFTPSAGGERSANYNSTQGGSQYNYTLGSVNGQPGGQYQNSQGTTISYWTDPNGNNWVSYN